jgi:hypothetical protein
MILSSLFESENTMSLWHGGRGLHYSYDEMMPHGKGRWEHGPGLYLTTHYATAAKYAKGGGTVYSVTIRKGVDIDQVKVSYDDAVEFVKRHVIKRFQKTILNDLKNNLARKSGDDNEIFISVIVNLCLNYQALTKENTVALRKYLIDHGVDYGIVKNFGGRNGDTVVVVFNPKIIVKVVKTTSKDVQSSDREKPFTL